MTPFHAWTIGNGIWIASDLRLSLEAVLGGPMTPVANRCPECTMPMPRERVSRGARARHVGSFKCKLYTRMGDRSKFIVKRSAYPNGFKQIMKPSHAAGLPVYNSDILVCKDTTMNDLRLERAWWIDEPVVRGVFEYQMLFRDGAIGDISLLDFVVAWCGNRPSEMAVP